jgi:hypothetical protein
MASRSRTLADAIVALILAWGSLPAGVGVARCRSVTHLLNDLPASDPAVIAVISSEITDQTTRGDVAEDITIGIVVIANCPSLAVADSDAWDDFTELLRDHLRTSTTFRNITVGSQSFARKAVSTSVVCDAQMMDQSELFVSVTEAVYYTFAGART